MPETQPPRRYPLNGALAWAQNSINACSFRRNALVSFKSKQYAAFYNQDSRLVLASRVLGSGIWEISESQYFGDTRDAHRSISLMVDGKGFIHVAWDHHDTALRYAKSKQAESLELGDEACMDGKNIDRLSYPEFYRFPKGDLLFMYRDGQSGKGCMEAKYYNLDSSSWSSLEKLIDGEGKSSPYWQTWIDEKGCIHVSWVWRDSWDASTNHDLCYAASSDGGKTWKNSSGETYSLPITQANAEYAARVPLNSELINQCGMCTFPSGDIIIANYWRAETSKVPEYQIVYTDGGLWKHETVSSRSLDFQLSGGGTKRIPLSRPQVLAWEEAGNKAAALLVRDEEFGSKAQILLKRNLKDSKAAWERIDLSLQDLGAWEACFDSELWKSKRQLNLWVQALGQKDHETSEDYPPQVPEVLEWIP